MKLRDFFASTKGPPLTTNEYATVAETTILASPRSLVQIFSPLNYSHSEQDALSYTLVAFEAPSEWILEDIFGISG
ncbi:hypothetical protein TWF173_000233 [Orbilia oligospora]|nr:hypothetical protein TWF173_000233 [Orbilia oligospora]